MISTISNTEYNAIGSITSWIITSASKCSIPESELFKILVLNVVLSNPIEQPSLWKLVLTSVWKAISILLWTMLILVIFSSIGRQIAFGETSISVAPPKSVEIENIELINQKKEKNIKIDLDTALIESRQIALKVASNELDTWKANIMKRVDDPKNDRDFLDWYFAYWTQQGFGFDALKGWLNHQFNKNSPTAKEKIQETVFQEFTNKVLRPEIAKLELKNISRDISQAYSNELRKNLDKVRIRYNVPTADWNSYLQGLTVSVTNFNGRQVSLNLKAIAIGSISGTAILAKPSLLAIEKITAKIGVKVVTKAAASVSAKVGAFAGGELLGLPATVAILAWDAIDIHNTEVKSRPILKQSIEDYFDEIKKDILTDEENGIQKVILDLENNVRNGITASHFPFLPF